MKTVVFGSSSRYGDHDLNNIIVFPARGWQYWVRGDPCV